MYLSLSLSDCNRIPRDENVSDQIFDKVSEQLSTPMWELQQYQWGLGSNF